MFKRSIIIRSLALFVGIIFMLSFPLPLAYGQGAQVGPQATQVQIPLLTGYNCPNETLSPIIMTEGFEGIWPFGSWSTTGNPTWDDSNYKPRTDAYSAWVAKGGTNGLNPATSNYPNNANARMIYGPFNLSNALGARLTFYYWNQSESNYDWLYWLVSRDATNFYGYRVSGNSSGWQSVTFDLTSIPTIGSVAGYNCVWIGFFFTSDVSLNYKGAFIDDVVLEKTRWGAIYNPNPVAATGNTSLVDNFDADSTGLTIARSGKALRGLDGTGYLRGSYADLATGSGNFSVCDTVFNRGLAFSDKLQFFYTRSDARFEEANIYYHVDNAQRYIQSLNLGFGLLNYPIPVHAHCFSDSGASASNVPLTLRFGDGGADAGEDGEIVTHEYGHLILHEQIPLYTPLENEGDILHEGFGDYWAATVLAGSQTATWQPCFADWFALERTVPYSNPKCLRRLDNTKTYPNDLALETHLAGQIWSGTLWQARNALGQNYADQLVLRSHTYLDSEMRFGEAANALISADFYYTGGANLSTLKNILQGRGIFDSSEWNNDSPRSTSITPNANAQFHRLGAKSDVDWFKFTANGFSPSWRYAYRIRTFDLANAVDTEITVYSSNGVTVLGENDDCPEIGDFSSCYLLAVPSTGTYYVAVKPHIPSLSSTGYDKTYRIEVTTIYLPLSVYLPIIMK